MTYTKGVPRLHTATIQQTTCVLRGRRGAAAHSNAEVTQIRGLRPDCWDWIESNLASGIWHAKSEESRRRREENSWATSDETLAIPPTLPAGTRTQQQAHTIIDHESKQPLQ